MSRDYETIHFIRYRMTGLDDKLTSAVIRMHNRLNDRMMYASALSTSVTLFLSMKHLGFEPKLILGTVQFQGLSYPHAWIELDDKIFDLATSQDIKYHPVLKDRGLAAVKPMINIAYEEASSSICYYPFQFGATWELANMYKAVGKTLEKYMDESLHIDILGDACYILDIPETPDNLDSLRTIAKSQTIRDKDNSDVENDVDKSENTRDDPSSANNALDVVENSNERHQSGLMKALAKCKKIIAKN